MKRSAILLILALSLAWLAPRAAAQMPDTADKNPYNHGALGGFVDFTRQQGAGFNLLGAGGRIGFNVHRHVVLEAEMAYDFEKTKTQTVTAGGVTNTTRSSLRLLHAVFGAKVQTTGNFRYFALAKAGLLNFGLGGPATAGAIGSQIGNITDGDTKMIYYPGGGVEWGRTWLSVRAEIGDEIYSANGLHHNIRVTVGPQFRF
ncbi:MAG: hypothetical protein LAO20_06430 [Acidobacteriia bacterium]|nr:hypothetical protein [Terriglobia bacterium]